MNPEVKAGQVQTDLGLIPIDWSVTRIDAHCSIKTGSRNTQDRVEGGAYPFYVRSQKVERINSYSYDGEAVLTAGDGVGTGKVFHYINGKFDVHQRVYRITDFSNHLHGRYFFYQFSTRFYERIMSMTAKSSVDSVRMEMIAGMQIPLPSVQEQVAIASALDDIDALLSSLDQLIAKKRDIHQATMQQLLTGQRRLPGFSGEWEGGQLRDVVRSLEAGVSVNSNDDLPEPGLPCVLKTSALSCGTFSPNEAKAIVAADRTRACTNPKRNTILISRMNTPALVGEIAYVEKDYNWLFLPDRLWMTQLISDDCVNVRWLAYLLSSRPYRKLLQDSATGTSGSMKNISKGVLLNLQISYPAIEEQTAIATILSDMDAELTALEARRDKARQLKQGMMQELLTGRIRLIDKEPV